MQIGQKGVKYGLQLRGPSTSTRKLVGGQAPAPAQVAAAFGVNDSDSEEDNVGAQVARQAARKQSDAKVQEMYAQALAADPNVFDYDGVYDNMQQQKAAPKDKDKVERRSKYIAALVEQAQVRKKEQDIAFERKLLKERQKEDAEFDDEEKFVTAAYRKKLEEDKKWIEAQKLRELEEEQQDVRKLGHMNNFYQNLTKNVALGGKAAQKGTTVSPAAAAAGAAAGDAGIQPSTSNGHAEGDAAGAAATAAAGPSREGGMDRRKGEDAAHEESIVRTGARSEDGQVGLGEAAGPSGRTVGGETSPRAPGSPQARALPGQGCSSPLGGAAAQAVPAGTGEEDGRPAAAAGGGGGAMKRKVVDDAAVAAARERYLARKRQHTSS